MTDENGPTTLLETCAVVLVAGLLWLLLVRVAMFLARRLRKSAAGQEGVSPPGPTAEAMWTMIFRWGFIPAAFLTMVRFQWRPDALPVWLGITWWLSLLVFAVLLLIAKIVIKLRANHPK